MISYKMSLETRLCMLAGCVLIFLPFSIGGPWLAIEEVGEYLNYPDTVVFSSFSVFALCAPIALGPMIYLSIYSALVGEKAPLQYQRKAVFIMAIGLVLGIVIAVAFHIYYVESLSSLGYKTCNGIPSGYMPGMGKEYVTDISLCDR